MPAKFIPMFNDSLLMEYIELEQTHENLRMSGTAAITQQDATQYDIKRAYYYSKLGAMARQVTKKDDYCFCGSGKPRKSAASN